MTVRGHRLYANVFTWPDGGITLKYLKTEPLTARVVATGERLALTRDPDGTVTIARPKKTDPISTAVEITLKGAPVVEEPEARVMVQADGTYRLGVFDAVLAGTNIQTQSQGLNASIGFWTNASDTAEWRLDVPAANAGTYGVRLDCSCVPGSEGSHFRLLVDGEPSGVEGVVAATGGWDDYHTVELTGAVTLKPGVHTVRIQAFDKPAAAIAVMNIKGISLTPTR